MLLHCAIHLTNSGIGLRQLCDWAVFVSTFTEEEFQDIFEDKLKQAGLWQFAKILSQLGETYLHCPRKKCFGTSNDILLAAMMSDIFVSGNFGHKDMSRADEGKLITNSSKGTVDDVSLAKQLVQSVNDIVCTHWSIAKKYKVLLPIGAVVFGGRYAVRMLIGKRRSIQPKQMIINAKARREIYKELQLYCSEEI